MKFRLSALAFYITATTDTSKADGIIRLFFDRICLFRQLDKWFSNLWQMLCDLCVARILRYYEPYVQCSAGIQSLGKQCGLLL